MSWDVLLQKFPREASQPQDVPDDYVAPAIGSRAQVTLALRKLFRGVEGADDSSLTLSGSSFTIEIVLGDEEECSQLLLHVRGDGGQATKAILRMAEHFGLRAIDCSTSEFIEKERTRGTSDKEREDEARYRRKIEEYRKNPVPPAAWPLSGLTCGPCERYVYLSLLPGESPKQQQKAVYRHWRDLFKEHGEVPTAIMGPRFVLTLPNGEVLGDFSVALYPGLAEMESEMISRVQKAAALVHAFAVATLRKSGEIANGLEFVYANGERIPLAECEYQQLHTDADFSKKVEGKKK
jgi:hypothetical protein